MNSQQSQAGQHDQQLKIEEEPEQQATGVSQQSDSETPSQGGTPRSKPSKQREDLSNAIREEGDEEAEADDIAPLMSLNQSKSKMKSRVQHHRAHPPSALSAGLSSNLATIGSGTSSESSSSSISGETLPVMLSMQGGGGGVNEVMPKSRLGKSSMSQMSNAMGANVGGNIPSSGNAGGGANVLKSNSKVMNEDLALTIIKNILK